MPGFVIFIAAFAVFALVWAVSFSVDKERITSYVQKRGGRIMSISWAPFGKGWFGEKNERIFEVVYYDSHGNQHFATCKTSFFSGVYWTEDRIAHRKSAWFDSLSPGNEPGNPVINRLPKEVEDDDSGELARLREENARLRRELEKSRRQS